MVPRILARRANEGRRNKGVAKAAQSSKDSTEKGKDKCKGRKAGSASQGRQSSKQYKGKSGRRRFFLFLFLLVFFVVVFFGGGGGREKCFAHSKKGSPPCRSDAKRPSGMSATKGPRNINATKRHHTSATKQPRDISAARAAKGRNRSPKSRGAVRSYGDRDWESCTLTTSMTSCCEDSCASRLKNSCKVNCFRRGGLPGTLP